MLVLKKTREIFAIVCFELRQIRFICLISIIFCVVIVTELSLTTPVLEELEDDGISPINLLPRAPQEISSTERNNWIVKILARPIFTRDRRPDKKNNDNALPIHEMPRLSGIAISPFSRTAIFSRPGETSSLVLHEGMTLGAWRIQEISSSKVMLVGPGGTQSLQPVFDKKLPPPSLKHPLTSLGPPGSTLRPGMPLSSVALERPSTGTFKLIQSSHSPWTRETAQP